MLPDTRVIYLFNTHLFKCLLYPRHCIQELEIKDIIGITLTVTSEDLYKKETSQTEDILLVNQDINRPLKVNSCISRLVVYQASKRYAQLSVYLQFSSIYCWTHKNFSSVFLSLCSLVISCSGRLMLSPCIENLYTQRELVREIDQNFVILLPFQLATDAAGKDCVETQCWCFHVLADMECSLQKKDVLFLRPSMSLIIDHIFFLNLSLLLRKAINDVWLSGKKVNKFWIIYNSI